MEALGGITIRGARGVGRCDFGHCLGRHRDPGIVQPVKELKRASCWAEDDARPKRGHAR